MFFWVTDKLAIGDSTVAADIVALHSNGIWCSVNVAQEIHYDVSHDHVLLKCGGVIAGRPILPLIRAILVLAQDYGVLVHCAGGMNRSPAVAICCLIEMGQPEQAARALLVSKGTAPTESIIQDYKRERGI